MPHPAVKSARVRRGGGVVFCVPQLLLLPTLLAFVAALAAHAAGPIVPKSVRLYGPVVAMPAFALAAIMVFAVSFAENLLSRWRLRLLWIETGVALALLAATILLAKHTLYG